MMERDLWGLMLAVAVAVTVPAARGVWMELPSSGVKCISEELHNNVVVMADYFCFYGDDDDLNTTLTPTISVKVSSPFRNYVYEKEKVSYGQFAFTSTETGTYLACFSVDGHGGNQAGKTVTVGLDWKTGIAAKDWESVAKKEKVEGLDLELRKLEGLVQAIHENLNHLMGREMEMRDVNERTNGRVALYSTMSLGVCIVVSVSQLWYLRRYFQKKKLI